MVKRRYYRKRRTNVKKIMRNYFKARLDYVMRITFDSQAVKFPEWNAANKSLAGILEACSDWGSYSKIFHTFRVTGIAAEVVPNLAIKVENQFNVNGSVLFAFLTDADNAESFQNVAESKFCFICSPTNTQRKYLSLNGGLTGWLSTNSLSELNGKFVTTTNSLAQAGGMVWNIKLSIYVTFKNPN